MACACACAVHIPSQVAAEQQKPIMRGIAVGGAAAKGAAVGAAEQFTWQRGSPLQVHKRTTGPAAVRTPPVASLMAVRVTALAWRGSSW